MIETSEAKPGAPPADMALGEFARVAVMQKK